MNLSLISTLLKALVLMTERLLVFMAGRSYEKGKQLEEEVAHVKEEAQDWADSPRSMDDFTIRLHKLADRKRKDRS